MTGWQRPFEDPIPLPRGRQLGAANVVVVKNRADLPGTAEYIRRLRRGSRLDRL